MRVQIRRDTLNDDDKPCPGRPGTEMPTAGAQSLVEMAVSYVPVCIMKQGVLFLDKRLSTEVSRAHMPKYPGTFRSCRPECT